MDGSNTWYAMSLAFWHYLDLLGATAHVSLPFCMMKLLVTIIENDW